MCRWFTSEGLKRGVPALAVCVQVKEGLTRGADLEGARAGAGGARGGGRGGGALQGGGVLGDGGAKKRQAVRGLAGPKDGRITLRSSDIDPPALDIVLLITILLQGPLLLSYFQLFLTSMLPLCLKVNRTSPTLASSSRSLRTVFLLPAGVM